NSVPRRFQAVNRRAYARSISGVDRIPLTLTLSPRRGSDAARADLERGTDSARTAEASPSPWGEGWGEGDCSARFLGAYAMEMSKRRRFSPRPFHLVLARRISENCCCH